MATQPIDYEALAKQYGAVSSQSVDYDALAKQHGAISSAKPQAEQPGYFERLGQGLGLPTSKEEVEALKPSTSDTLLTAALGPVYTAAKAVKGIAQRTMASEPEFADAIQNVREGGPVKANVGKAGYAVLKGSLEGGLSPVGGQAVQNFGEDIHAKNYTGAAGDASALTAIASLPKAIEKAPEIGNLKASLLDKFPSVDRAGEKFQSVSKVAGAHTVNVTPSLSDALFKYQELVDTGGSRSLAVSKLLNRLTNPDKGPLTYDEARLFQSNISRLSADETQRLTPVMKRQVGQIASELNGAVENTAAGAGKLSDFRAAMEEYSKAKTNEARAAALKKWAIKAGAAATLGAAGVSGVKLLNEL